MRIEIKDKDNFICMFNKMYKNINLKKINGITIDSRKVMPNDIFIPIKGKKFNGHDFIKKSFSLGASVCFSQEKIEHDNIIKTDSVTNEVNKICKKWKDKSKAKIIGITGSNGKTTTKDLLYHIFKNKYMCSKTIGNFNSSIGFPISFLNTNLSDNYSILEYGASKPNEIKYLCDIISPDYSLITNISGAHIANFKSLEELHNTKTELFKSTNKNGTCFINTDRLSINMNELKSKKITFSFKNKSDYNAQLIKNKNRNYLSINNNKFFIPDYLLHITDNILAVCIISNILKIDTKYINQALKSFELPKGRGNIIKYNDYILIDDSYNANPSSLKLAIKRIDNIQTKGKKILVLGDMLELGENELQEHENISNLINESTIDILLTYGKLSKSICKNIKDSKYYKHYTNKNKLKIEASNLICRNDLIYLKGSRSMQLEKIYINK